MTCIVFRPPHISSCHRLWTCLGKQANVPSWYLPGLALLCATFCRSHVFARAPLETMRCLACEDLRGRRRFLGHRRSRSTKWLLGHPSCSRASVASSYCGMGIHFGLADVTASCGLGPASHAIVDVRKPRTCRRVKGRIPHLQRIKGTGANVGDGPYTLRPGLHVRGIGSCARTGRVAAGARSRTEGHGQVPRLPVLPLGHVVGLQSDDPLYFETRLLDPPPAFVGVVVKVLCVGKALGLVPTTDFSVGPQRRPSIFLSCPPKLPGP